MLANEDFQRISFLPLIETKGDDNWFTRVPTIMIDDAEESENNGGGRADSGSLPRSIARDSAYSVN